MLTETVMNVYNPSHCFEERVRVMTRAAFDGTELDVARLEKPIGDLVVRVLKRRT